MLWKGNLYSWWIKKQIPEESTQGGTAPPAAAWPPCLASLPGRGEQDSAELSVRQCDAVAWELHSTPFYRPGN